MNLYFLDKEDKQHLVATGVEEENVVDLAINDLGKRYPEMKSYYQRCWWDNFHRYWIDYGSYTEFYILQDEKYALNVVDVLEDEPKEEGRPACSRGNRDYCDI